MTPEQRPASPDSDQQVFDAVQDESSFNQTEFNPYQAAMEIYELVVEFMKERGELRRPSDITSEAEMDDHFDDLRRVYHQTITFLGLDQSPTIIHDIPLEDDEE